MVLTRNVQKRVLSGVGESGSLKMALQVPHANATVGAGLHQGEAYLSERYQSSPCQWGRAQQVFSPGELLGFEHHPLVAKQSKALVPELIVTYLQNGVRKESALLCAP